MFVYRLLTGSQRAAANFYREHSSAYRAEKRRSARSRWSCSRGARAFGAWTGQEAYPTGVYRLKTYFARPVASREIVRDTLPRFAGLRASGGNEGL
jgi:hypothetical protein